MTVHVAFETPQDVHEIVYEMVKALGKDGRGSLKKGANEVTKAAERGTAMMVVMAEDVNPANSRSRPNDLQGEIIPFMYVRPGYLARPGMSEGTKTAAVAVIDVKKDGEDRFNEVKGHFETLSA